MRALPASYGEDKTFATSYPPAWLVNGKGVFSSAIKSEGTLIVKDTGLEVTAECAIDETGEAVIGAEGKITKVTNTTGGTTITCHPIQSGWCGTAAVEVNAAYLPWKAELTDVPTENTKGEVHYEVRNRFYGTPTPGWTIKCAFMGSVATDTCLGETSGNVKNATSGVTVGFDSKSPALTCTGSAIGTGALEGVLAFSSTTTGNTLSVYGAPGP
jgi:hypothetical protein